MAFGFFDSMVAFGFPEHIHEPLHLLRSEDTCKTQNTESTACKECVARIIEQVMKDKKQRPDAKPSSPSVKLTAFEAPTVIKPAMNKYKKPKSIPIMLVAPI